MSNIEAYEAVYYAEDEDSVFPIPFAFASRRSLKAFVEDADGSGFPLGEGEDYLVNLMSDGNGELVLLGEPLAPGQRLVIQRAVPDAGEAERDGAGRAETLETHIREHAGREREWPRFAAGISPFAAFIELLKELWRCLTRPQAK